MTEWQSLIVTSDAGIPRLLQDVKTVAVLGIKTVRQADQPAYYVPAYCASVGLTVIPVPVYYPDVTEILGQTAYRTLAAIPGPVDMVNVFRRPTEVPQHVDDILAKRPRAVWMQLGIRNDEAAERFARAGIAVVQDRCLMVELQKLPRR